MIFSWIRNVNVEWIHFRSLCRLLERPCEFDERVRQPLLVVHQDLHRVQIAVLAFALLDQRNRCSRLVKAQPNQLLGRDRIGRSERPRQRVHVAAHHFLDWTVCSLWREKVLDVPFWCLLWRCCPQRTVCRRRGDRPTAERRRRHQWGRLWNHVPCCWYCYCRCCYWHCWSCDRCCGSAWWRNVMLGLPWRKSRVACANIDRLRIHIDVIICHVLVNWILKILQKGKEERESNKRKNREKERKRKKKW